MKRLLFKAASVILISSMLFSCSDSESDVKTTTVSDSEYISVAESTIDATSSVIKADVPDDLSFDGHTFTLMGMLWGTYDEWAATDLNMEELMKNALDDSIYNRNRRIEDLYDCKITSILVQNDGGAFQTQLRDLVLSGDDTIDVAFPYAYAWGTLVTQSVFMNLNEIAEIDLSNPWYDANSYEALSIINRRYGIVSDITYKDKDATMTFLFNKKLYSDLQYESKYGSVYDIVKNQEWDIDLFYEMICGAANDLDGDHDMDEYDQYGLLYHRDAILTLLNGCNEYVSQMDGDDEPYISVVSDGGLSVLEKIYDILYDQEHCLHGYKYYGWTGNMEEMFAADQILWLSSNMCVARKLRGMETNFGIIPVPKYDETQEDYINSISPYTCPITTIPNSTIEVERTSYFIEVLACESRNMVNGVYYEKTLQGVTTRDNESIEMLDIIFATRSYDLGPIFNFGSVGDTLINATLDYDRSFMTRYARLESRIQKQIEYFIQELYNID